MTILRQRFAAKREIPHGDDTGAGPVTRRRDVLLVAAVAAVVNLLVSAVLVASTEIWPGYPLDDTYIHLAMARTLVEHGIWGLTRFDPAAASSSPLYTLLLAGGLALTPERWHLAMPLVLNLAAVPLVTAAAAAVLVPVARGAVGGVPPLAGVLLASLAIPLPVMVLCGMEHALQAAIVIAVPFVIVRAATGAIALRHPMVIGLVSGMLLGAVRYDTLVVAAACAVILVAARQGRLGTALCLGAALPGTALGLIWIGHEGWLLPNSILMKRLLNADGLPQEIIGLKLLGVLMLTVAVAAVATAVSRIAGWRSWQVLYAAQALVYATALAAAHAVGWLFRYEAAATGSLVVALLALTQLWAVTAWRPVLVSVAAGTVAVRAFFAAILALGSASDREWEHLAPARLVQQWFPRSAVVANDVGAMAWINPDVRVLDLVGLANNAMAGLRQAPGRIGPEAVRDWAAAQGAEIAVLQVCWSQVQPFIPPEWVQVGIWKGPRNMVFEDLYVGFYAVRPAAASRLAEALARITPPDGVTAFDTWSSGSPHLRMRPEQLRGRGCPLKAGPRLSRIAEQP